MFAVRVVAHHIHASVETQCMFAVRVVAHHIHSVETQCMFAVRVVAHHIHSALVPLKCTLATERNESRRADTFVCLKQALHDISMMITNEGAVGTSNHTIT
jgi:hypothetical protein